MFKYFLLLSLSVYIATEAKEVCYGELGCFSDECPFCISPHRPSSPLPESPEKILTKFTLFTLADRNGGKVIKHDNIISDFNPNKKTIIIVPGILHSDTKQWVIDMRLSLLSADDINVITVDWSKGNGPLYHQAVANARVVGAEIARLINEMVKNVNANAVSFHIIGHSLGAHVASYAGERVKGLGRITGLDPAGPHFENMPAKVRLDENDAEFVDVIHSDGTSGLGLLQQSGTVDFLPNGGKNQPKCSATSSKTLSAIKDNKALSSDAIEGNHNHL
jgi:pimeloyl-ACP methyl ester carboxylesterase